MGPSVKRGEALEVPGTMQRVVEGGMISDSFEELLKELDERAGTIDGEGGWGQLIMCGKGAGIVG